MVQFPSFAGTQNFSLPALRFHIRTPDTWSPVPRYSPAFSSSKRPRDIVVITPRPNSITPKLTIIMVNIRSLVLYFCLKPSNGFPLHLESISPNSSPSLQGPSLISLPSTPSNSLYSSHTGPSVCSPNNLSLFSRAFALPLPCLQVSAQMSPPRRGLV